MLRNQIHSLAQLVDVDQGANHDQGTQHIPEPEGTGIEAVVDSPALQLIADPVADPMVPHNGGDSQGKPGENKDQQAIMHGFLAIIAAGCRVDIRADAGHDHNGINAKGDETQQNELEQASVGVQLSYRGVGIGCV